MQGRMDFKEVRTIVGQTGKSKFMKNGITESKPGEDWSIINKVICSIQLRSKMNMFIAIFVIYVQHAASQENDTFSHLATQLDHYCKIKNGTRNIDLNLCPITPRSDVNYTLIEDIIGKTIRDQLNDMFRNTPVNNIKEKFDENWQEVQTLKSVEQLNPNHVEPITNSPMTSTSNGRVCARDHLHIEGKCFVVIVKRMKPKKAASVCKGMGGKMANIYSSSQYEKIMNYIRPYLTANMLEILLGMTYDPESSTVFLSTGETAPFLSWLNGWPTLRLVGQTQMAILVNRFKLSRWKGMFNYSPTGYKYHGVLCEIYA